MRKKKVAKFLKKLAEYQKENGYCLPKKIGESRSVEYEIDGLANSMCKVTAWSNGEGFDISFRTNINNCFQNKSINLQCDEIECLLIALDYFKYFGE